MFAPRNLLSRWWKPQVPGSEIVIRAAPGTTPAMQRHLPQWRCDWLPSVGFWVCLAMASLLGGGLALAPRALTGEELRERYRRNLTQLTALEREIAHWNQLAVSLRDDPQFVARLAAAEFGDSDVNTVQISRGSGLEFDPRTFETSQFPARFAPASWTTSLLELFAGDSLFQSRIRLAVTLLLVLAVGCCHETFVSGKWTRNCLQMAARTLTRYIQSPGTSPRARRT